MTNTLSLSDLATQLEQAQAALNLAQADLDLASRIKTAAERAKKASERIAALTPAYEQAVAEHVKAEAVAEEETEKARVAAEEAAKDALFAGLSDLHIEERADLHNPSVLKSTFIIRWSRPQWDGRETLQQPTSVVGFKGLGANVSAWIIERNADKIPASIMSLAPNDPREALDIYLAALDRGYLKS